MALVKARKIDGATPAAAAEGGDPLAWLEDADPAQRRRAAHALGERPDAVPALSARLAREADPSVRETLLTALVRHAQETQREGHVESTKALPQSKSWLTEDEIYSNLFGVAFAGHETTAHTLAYALFLLAAYPPMQDWVAEEISSVIGDQRDLEDLHLDEIYPRLNRTRAIMSETLRIFAPLANALRKTVSSQTQLY